MTFFFLFVCAGANAELVYSLLDPADGAFSIDEHSGVLRLAAPLNRELRPSYTLRARAADRGWPRPLSTVCSVTVSVLDLNDDPPVFQHREYVATVPEDVAAGTQVLHVRAASRDAEAQISYSIVDGNDKGAFSVDTHTGKRRSAATYGGVLTPLLTSVSQPKRKGQPCLILVLARVCVGVVFVIAPLDYEASREFSLTVEATDGETPSLSDRAVVSINVTDVNDNSPVFSQTVYAAVVSEDIEPGKAVLTVSLRPLMTINRLKSAH